MTGRPVPEAYGTALDSPCPTCGAAPGEFCLVDDDRQGPRLRRVPCVRRSHNAGGRGADALAVPVVSEPLRGERDEEPT